MKRIAALLAFVLLIPQFALAEITVSLVTDPKPGRATIHGLDELRSALKAKGVRVQEAATLEAATGDFAVVAGTFANKGPVSGLFVAYSYNPVSGLESLLIQRRVSYPKKPL